VLTVINGVFSMSETAVVSVKRIRLQQRAEAGDDNAAVALDLAQRPDKFLSTVQIGITLIGILAGAFGGSELSDEAAKLLTQIGVPTANSKPLGLALVVGLITYLSLVIGELVPKTLALNNPEKIATQIAKPMRFLSVVASPLVFLLSASTRGILWLMRVKPSDEPPVTEDEIKMLIAQGTKAGVFADEEKEIVEGVFRTADRRVSSLMTPRREVAYLDVEDPWEENRGKIKTAGYSAFPVCEGGMDNLLGIAVLKTMWEVLEEGRVVDLRSIIEKPIFVLESTRALKALDVFRGAKQHIALVVDEYGGVVGLITLHDIVEALIGEVPDITGVRPSEAVQREDGSWLLDGMLPMDDLLHLMKVKQIPEDIGEYATLGGFVMARLGRIPSVGDIFEWDGTRFEVLDMDGNRVDRVLAQKAVEQTTTA
jgi:putative hemolysin